jgi:SAM-dependent methyltransferase
VVFKLGNRADLLHRLCRRDSCNSYLEIGCNRNKLFKTIPVEDKVGVDPKRGGTHRMTSDEFFKQNDRTFDLIFIDGLHHADQVMRDLESSLRVLNANGVIAMHDCNPATEEAQRVPPPRSGVPWNGDVWKTVVVLRSRPDLDIAVGDFDYGCGVVLRRPNSSPLSIEATLETLQYADLEAHRREWLRLMPPEELVRFIGA